MDGFIKHWWLLGTGACKVDIVARRKVRASADLAPVIGVETICDRALLYIHVPTIHEIGVETVASGIAIRKDKLSTSRLINPVREVEYPKGERGEIEVASILV